MRKHGSYSAGGLVRARVTFYIKLWNGVWQPDGSCCTSRGVRILWPILGNVSVIWCIFAFAAANFVNSSTPYTYDLRTQTYFQPNAACHILHRVRSVNAQKFKNLKLQKTLDLGEGYKPAQPGTSLYEFCDVSKEEVAKAPVVLDLLTKELGEQTV